MRTAIFYVFFLLLLGCTAERQKATLSPSNLESFYARINPSKDTVLRTPKGAAIRIKKGTFTTMQELEIKEAYTMKDILLAGLRTESNGTPLRSGGMIYINTRNGEDVALQKPITVLLPANGIEAGMELFKGEEKSDSVNWVQTDTLQPTVSEAMLQTGKLIYTRNCMTCHNINRTLTGPPLRGVTQRGPWKEFGNLVRWVHNTGSFIATTAYTQQLLRQYNGQLMPSFPQLSEYEIASIMAFINNESQKAITDTFRLPDSYYTADTSAGTAIGEIYKNPCGDTTYYSERDSLYLSDDYVSSVLNEANEPANAGPQETIESKFGDPLSMQGMRMGFTDVQLSDGAYLFEIKTLGWYNVDAFVAGMPGTTLCDLQVSVNGSGESGKLNVYAFFPQQKNLSVGMAKAQGKFSFEKVTGKIPLYLGEKGIAVAFGNQGDQFYYGTAHFTVKESQTILINVSKASEEDFLNAIKAEKIDGINLDVTRQKMIVTPCKGDSSQQFYR